MRVREKTKQEIEERYAGMGDFVKLDYLSSCLKKSLDFDTRKFVLVKLGGLYEQKRMYSKAGSSMISAAEINTTFQNKINDFVKASELFVKAGDYSLAEGSMKKAIALANVKQKVEIKNSVKEFYKAQARVLVGKDRRNHALLAYESLLNLDLDENESPRPKGRGID